MRTRVVPTASGKKAIQVVSKRYGKVTIHKHIGTYATHEEKIQLLRKAEKFIVETTGQTSLLDILSTFKPSDIAVFQNRPLFIYELLSGVYDKLGLSLYPDKVIKDLIITRIYQPASKREITEVLSDSFGRDYALKTLYQHLKAALGKGIKDQFQKALIGFTRNESGDSLKLVFYDVTTLYFESAVKDGLKGSLKDFGFSKDHRPMDTQIVVGLVVNLEGFPLYFDIFQGNTFEGHTFIPVIKNIQTLLGSTDLVVIADSAMISKDNIEKLTAENIGFVVGARIANLSPGLIDSISSTLNQEDGKIIVTSYHGHRLICQYLSKRAAKDKSDRLKQVAKANLAISNTSRITGRFRFIKADGERYSLNIDLVRKAQKLEGIKGYLTV